MYCYVCLLRSLEATKLMTESRAFVKLIVGTFMQTLPVKFTKRVLRCTSCQDFWIYCRGQQTKTTFILYAALKTSFLTSSLFISSLQDKILTSPKKDEEILLCISSQGKRIIHIQIYYHIHFSFCFNKIWRSKKSGARKSLWL